MINSVMPRIFRAYPLGGIDHFPIETLKSRQAVADSPYWFRQSKTGVGEYPAGPPGLLNDPVVYCLPNPPESTTMTFHTLVSSSGISCSFSRSRRHRLIVVRLS